MHGRLKVRTSEEEALRKKKEHDLKAKAMRIGMTKIFELRERQQLDTPLMDLTAKILSVNPDIVTLWNIRRECILKMTEIMEGEEKDVQKIFDFDLGFTENCLTIQPKSYSTWHHRIWVLENCPVADWNREVDLCTKYLKRDERNFHCWDYRKFAVKKANIPEEKEFEFCDEKIQKNFSNYSSWHYRSQLLPILYPHETDKSRPISEEKLKEELELVITAAFTDPNDSSAWFYQRWLLGYSDPEFDLATVKISNRKVVATFTKAIDLNEEGIKISCSPLGDLSTCSWVSVSGEKFDTAWQLEGEFKQPQENCFKIIFEIQNQSLTLQLKKVDGVFVGVKLPKFGFEFGSTILEVLHNQLESCNQLLEYEPDSKWTLLTAALIMRSIDRFSFHKQTLEFLKKLEDVDKLRKGYYKDLASRWSIEVKLKEWIESGDYEKGKIDLKGLDLTTLYYSQYFMHISNEVDLRDNSLRNKVESSGDCHVIL